MSNKPKIAPAKLPYFCRKCVSPRPADVCWKCGEVAFVPPRKCLPHPRLPDIEKMQGVGRELGYAIAVHGSLQRDLDLVAIPWVENAVDHQTLIDALCLAMNARSVRTVPVIEIKPHGRMAVSLQIDGWFKIIDLSIIPKQEKYHGGD